MYTFSSLERTSFDVLYAAFSEAFKDYEMQLSGNELQVMLQRRGFVPELSFGAFRDEKLVAFTFNGIGAYHGLRTAYDTGTGTLEEHRGQGLATRVFEYSLPFLQKARVQQYLLEVLQHNQKAISVYEKLGFQISREFNYFVQEQEKVALTTRPLDPAYHLKSIALKDLQGVSDFWDFMPSWQNDFSAMQRRADDFLAMGAFQAHALIAYCIFEPGSGDLTQMAVDRKHRRKGIASHLLRELLPKNRHPAVKAINTQVECTSITAFLASKSIPLRGKQFEMIRKIRASSRE